MTNLSLGIYDSNQPGQLLGPTIINSYSALTIPAYWRGVNFLGGNLASFPRSVRKDGLPLGKSHVLDRLLERRPNQYQTATVFWRHTFAQSVQEGNGFALIRRAAATSNGIVGLYNLSPYEVTPFRFKDQQFYHVQSEYERAKAEGKAEEDAGAAAIKSAADILHFPGLGFDGLVGYPPVVLLREMFQRARNTDRFLSKYLDRGTVIRGAIEIPGDISDEKLETIVKRLRTYYTGADADRDIAVLPNGAKLNNATVTPHDSQLLEQTSYSTKQIAQVLGIDPAFLFDLSESKYNGNVEQAGENVVRYTFRPWLDVIEDELSTKLLTDAEQVDGYTIHLDPSALLRGDIAAQTNLALAKKAAGVYTANDVLRSLGEPPKSDPEADKLKVSGDTSPIKGTAPTPVKSAQPVEPERDTFSALQPIIADAVDRVETKTRKAFDNKADTVTAPWANVFSEQQATYVHEALRPVAEAVAKLDGRTLDVAKIAEKYAAAIRKRAADGTIIELATLVAEGIK